MLEEKDEHHRMAVIFLMTSLVKPAPIQSHKWTISGFTPFVQSEEGVRRMPEELGRVQHRREQVDRALLEEHLPA